MFLGLSNLTFEDYCLRSPGESARSSQHESDEMFDGETDVQSYQVCLIKRSLGELPETIQKLHNLEDGNFILSLTFVELVH